MRKFFIFNILIAIMFVLIITTIHFFIFQLTELEQDKVSTLMIKHSIILDLSHILSKSPQNKWNDIIKSLHTFNAYPVQVVKFTHQKSIKTKPTKTTLLGTLKQILLPVRKPTYIYKRIGNTNFSVRLENDNHINSFLERSFGWHYKLIYRKLELLPKDKWNTVLHQELNNFNKTTRLKLIKTLTFAKISNTKEVPPFVRKNLKTSDIVYCPSCQYTNHNYYYMTTPDPNIIIKLVAPIFKTHLVKLYLFPIVLIITMIIAILFSILVSYLFSRNVRKIHKMTIKIGQADFDSSPKISRMSILSDIDLNIKLMATSIKKLLNFRQKMTQFIAHETRTPLTTMQFAIDRIRKNGDLSAKTSKQIENIENDIDQLSQLIGNFLLYSQSLANKISVTKKNINLSNWLQTWFDHFQHTEIKLTLTIPPQLSALHTQLDPNLFRHVTDNLMTNALKFARTYVEVSLESNEKQILIHIDDDGPGIDINQATKVFNPFVTLEDTDRNYKHIGLGLSISKNIMDLHAGDIVISTSPLGGARFTIILPCVSCNNA